MCERCGELDQEINRYRALVVSVSDKMALTAIATLIEQREAEKRALHPRK